MCSVVATPRLLVDPRLRLGDASTVVRGKQQEKKMRLCPIKASTKETTEVDVLKEQLIAEAPRPVGHFMDEEEMLATSTFPIKPDKLIELAKAALAPGSSFSTNSKLVDAENFIFKAPVIGPLKYEEFQEALGNFKLREAFPVIFPCFHNFWVDPFEPSRVWFTYRFYSKNTGPIMGKPATNLSVDLTPCMHSFVFNEEGKIVKSTIGYAMDRDIGNSGGVGGVFGMLYAIGRPLPIPEAHPYKPSLQRRISEVIFRIGKFFRRRFRKKDE